MQTLSADVWHQMQFLFHLSVDKADGELDRVLEDACPDPELRTQVKLLVEAARTRSGPEGDGGQAPPRQRFSGYKIIRSLGTGGTGSVYLVERRTGASVQEAALKVFPGYDPESFFTLSFAREEFILARLTHPSIPRLLDAGVSDSGEPFLVMEFVAGEPLDDFCDAARLSVDDRLRLMLRVCDAVAYAHRNLVVHLDLKPSNLLASADEPAVKLLDFGTSKLLEIGRTLAIARMLTPGYAAPEQLRNEPSTTGCDIYALGAILFELLCGRKAFPQSSLAALAERTQNELTPEPMDAVVTEGAAEKRSTSIATLQRKLRGDLATIVAKCLAPAARDRYASVDALADDIRLYLAGRPIQARPPSRVYRFGKFVQRNRKGVIAASVALLVVLGSLGYGWWRQRQALVAAHRAVEMQQFMTRLFRLAHSGATGKPAATVGDLLQVGEETLPSFISNPADLRAAQMSIAESMYDDEDTKRALPLLLQLGEQARRAGDVAVEARADILASDLLYLTSEDLPKAQSLAERAMTLAPDRRISPELRTQVVAIYVQNKDGKGDRSPQSMDRLRAAVAESERTHAPEDQTASAMNILGLGLMARGQYDEALRNFHRALSIYKRTPYATCDKAETIKYMGSVEDQLGHDSAALADYSQSYGLQRQCAGDDDLGTLSAHAWMARELGRAGQPQAAIAAIEPDLPRWQKAVGKDSWHMRTPLMALVPAYLSTGRFADAEAASREEIRVLHGNTQQRSINMAVPESTLAAALAGQKRYAEALPWAKAALADYPPPPASAGAGAKERYASVQKVLTEVQAQVAARQK